MRAIETFLFEANRIEALLDALVPPFEKAVAPNARRYVESFAEEPLASFDQ